MMAYDAIGAVHAWSNAPLDFLPYREDSMVVVLKITSRRINTVTDANKNTVWTDLTGETLWHFQNTPM